MSLAQIFREAPDPIAAVALGDRDLVAFDLDRGVDNDWSVATRPVQRLKRESPVFSL